MWNLSRNIDYMNRNLAIVLLASLTLSFSFQQAQAQTFSSHGDGKGRKKPPADDAPLFDSGKSLFQKSFDDFTDSLDATGARMRKDYDDSLEVTRKKWKIEDETNEINNGSTLNGAFQNTQAQSMNSGGLYNTPSIGAGGAGFPVRGGFVTPNMQGRFYGSSAQNNGLYRKNGGGKNNKW
jgi:hypothetical protein